MTKEEYERGEPTKHMPPLYEYATEALFGELARRHPGFLYAGIRTDETNNFVVDFWRRGDPVVLVTLMHKIEGEIHRLMACPGDDGMGCPVCEA